MYHLLLVLPLLALPVWWLLPLRTAAEIYALVAVVSGAIYYVALRMMHTRLAVDPNLTSVPAHGWSRTTTAACRYSSRARSGMRAARLS
jgi:hypothetical protein